MLLGGKEFRDDSELDMPYFMSEMSQYQGKVGSASPAPILYQEAIESADEAYVVTLSQKLSGSYSNAVIGNAEATENGSRPACLLDSKSASAGETLIAIKLHELIQANMPMAQILPAIQKFINEMKTFFVLENHDNLQKNGRLNKVTGSLIHLLNIKLIMGANGNGEIALFEKCRGTKKMVQQLLGQIAKSGKDTQTENLVISHCNNLGLAEEIVRCVHERFRFKEIFIVPTGGLSSLYVDDGGVVMAF